MGCQALLQGIFLIQGLNLSLLQTHISCTVGRFFTVSATREAPLDPCLPLIFTCQKPHSEWQSSSPGCLTAMPGNVKDPLPTTGHVWSVTLFTTFLLRNLCSSPCMGSASQRSCTQRKCCWTSKSEPWRQALAIVPIRKQFS